MTNVPGLWERWDFIRQPLPAPPGSVQPRETYLAKTPRLLQVSSIQGSRRYLGSRYSGSWRKLGFLVSVNVSGGSGRHCLRGENFFSSSPSGKKTLKFHCQVRMVRWMNLIMVRRMILKVTRRKLIVILIFSVACYQNDRDRLREFLISWFQISAKKQPWYRSVNQIFIQVSQSYYGTGQSINF